MLSGFSHSKVQLQRHDAARWFRPKAAFPCYRGQELGPQPLPHHLPHSISFAHSSTSDVGALHCWLPPHQCNGLVHRSPPSSLSPIPGKIMDKFSPEAPGPRTGQPSPLCDSANSGGVKMQDIPDAEACMGLVFSGFSHSKVQLQRDSRTRSLWHDRTAPCQKA